MNVDNNTIREETINTQKIELICIDFDKTKKYYPMIETLVKLFVSNDNGTAKMQASNYIKNMNKQKLYIGDDGQIYPQFKLIIKDIL